MVEQPANQRVPGFQVNACLDQPLPWHKCYPPPSLRGHVALQNGSKWNRQLRQRWNTILVIEQRTNFIQRTFQFEVAKEVPSRKCAPTSRIGWECYRGAFHAVGVSTRRLLLPLHMLQVFSQQVWMRKGENSRIRSPGWVAYPSGSPGVAAAKPAWFSLRPATNAVRNSQFSWDCPPLRGLIT